MVYVVFLVFIVGMCITDRWLGGVLFLATVFFGCFFAYTIYDLIGVLREKKDLRKKIAQEIDRNRFLAIVSALIAKIAKQMA